VIAARRGPGIYANALKKRCLSMMPIHIDTMAAIRYGAVVVRCIAMGCYVLVPASRTCIVDVGGVRLDIGQ
jgi:hypothetical protein